MIRIAPEVAVSLLDNELVLLDGASGRYFGLNAVGSAIFTNLRKTGSPEEAAKALCDQYEVEPSRALSDVTALVDQLVARGLATRVR